MELFEKLDWNCFGIEPSKFVAKIASKRKITILQKSVLELSESNKFDFIFLDAEKTEYEAYYKRALVLARPGGLIAVDNVLWSGRVADDTVMDADTVAIRVFNEMVRHDDRVTLSMVPIADGLTLAQKK